MLKKLLTFILGLISSLSIFAYDFIDNGIYYTKYDDGVAVSQSKYPYYSGDIVIPETVTYKNVTYDVIAIGYSAFSRCELKTVTLPESITHIEYDAFNSCEILTSIKIPSSVKSIGRSAFSGCTGLKTVYITDLEAWCNIDFDGVSANPLNNAGRLIINGSEPYRITFPATIGEVKNYTFCNFKGLIWVDLPENVTRIGHGAFSSCSALTHINLPQPVKEIGYDAFWNCTSLASVTIPEEVETIGGSAFNGCNALTEITIPRSVKSIGSSAFRNCTALNKVNITDLAAWCSINFFNGNANPVYTAKNLYINDTLVTSLTIPGDIAHVNNYAFYGCESLYSIIISEGVESIGEEAFAYCLNLGKVTLPDSLETIGNMAFKFCGSLSSFNGKFATDDNRGLINNDGELLAFAPKGLTTYDIPAGALKVGDYVFDNCDKLTAVTLPEGLQTIGKYAFYNCSGVSEIILPEGLQLIDEYAFGGCSGLQSITLPLSLTDISATAFHYTPIYNDKSNWDGDLFYIGDCLMGTQGDFFSSYAGPCYVKEGTRMIAAGAFSQKSKLKQVILPSSLTTIGKEAFYYCYSLSDVTLPSALKYIGSKAFQGCSLMPDQQFGNSIEYIGNYAFYGCKVFTNVTLPTSLKEIGDWSFAYCENMTSFTLHEGIEKIGKHAFDMCYRLPGISLPNSVTSLGTGAFMYCSALKEISFGNSLEHIGAEAFRCCTSLKSVTIPESLESPGVGLFKGCSALESISGKYCTEDGRWMICSGELLDYYDNITEYDNYLLAVAPAGMTSFTVPEGVRHIGEGAFYMCDNVKAVNFPKSVVSIEENAFYNDKLTNLVIPKNIVEIKSGAFSSNPLYTVKVMNRNPDSINLSGYAFGGNNSYIPQLFVPEGSEESYRNADAWSYFKTITEFPTHIDLADGEEYTNSVEEEDYRVNYTREFADTEWQPLYVPFNMSYDEWSPYAEVAELHTVRGTDVTGDGHLDEYAIEFNTLSAGEIVPNIPYLIKAKTTGTYTFECEEKILAPVPDEEGSIDCSSTKIIYSLHGVYSPKENLKSLGSYTLADNLFEPVESDEYTLPPNRWYLKLTPRTGAYNQSALPQRVKLLVNGDEVSTNVDFVEMDYENGKCLDLHGFEVTKNHKGIYIQNGKKMIGGK